MARYRALSVSFFFVLVLIGCPYKTFIHDVKTAQKLWSHEHFYNNSDNFQFAIVSDRTGGHRPGVFPDAARKLNLLRPEFVMSVGDLIEGYTEDKTKLTTQWDEFRTYRGHKISAATEAKFGYDTNNLYIAFQCFEPNPGKIKALIKDHDGAIW
jgi:hypothetical protein